MALGRYGSHLRTAEVRVIGAIGLVVALSLAAVAARNTGKLNPDGVAYLHLARHIVEGRLDLAVSGARPPLLPVLISPFLAFEVEPLAAARIALAISAALFFAGSLFVARSLGTPPAVRVATAVTVGLASVAWSIEQITPDLLEDSLLLFAFGLICGQSWPERRAPQIGAGLLLGLAYYAKAVALPLGLLLLISVAVLRLWSRDGERRAVARAVGTTLAVGAITVVPWVATLSARFGRLTVLPIGRMAHAIAGPPDVDRRSPILLGFRAPSRDVSPGERMPPRFRSESGPLSKVRRMRDTRST